MLVLLLFIHLLVVRLDYWNSLLLLLFAFRDPWKEWVDSNFQIFSQNCQFHHRLLESLEYFNVPFIYQSEHYGLIFGPYGWHIIFTRSPLFHFFCVHFHFLFRKYTLHVCYIFNVNCRIILMSDGLNAV